MENIYTICDQCRHIITSDKINESCSHNCKCCRKKILIYNKDDKCKFCYDADVLTGMICIFDCGHWLCLDCFFIFLEKNKNCSCGKDINYKNITICGGDSRIFIKDDPTIVISGIDLDRIKCSQLYTLMVLKISGTNEINMYNFRYNGKLFKIIDKSPVSEYSMKNNGTIIPSMKLQGD